MDEDTKQGIPAIIAAARAQAETKIVNIAEGLELDGITAIPMVVTPSEGGVSTAESVLEEVQNWRRAFATRPERREGTAKLTELDGFIAHAVRFKDADSAVFVSGGANAPSFTSVLDYHQAVNAPAAPGSNIVLPPNEAALPRFGKHRGTYTPEFSPEWKAWKAMDGRPMSQSDFAELLREQVRCILDVTDPATPEEAPTLGELPRWFATKYARRIKPSEFYADSERMLTLAEGLTMSTNERVTEMTRDNLGGTSIGWENKAEASVAGVKVEVPAAFVLELPIFVGGARWQMPARLRATSTMDGDVKRIRWTYVIFGATETVLACVADMRTQVADKTGLPVFAGTPE